MLTEQPRRPTARPALARNGAALRPDPASRRAGLADADATLTELYGAHYLHLVRLAALLVHDTATAEEVVQDSFVAMHSAMHRLRESGKALAYLRTAVVNRSRSELRHRIVADGKAPGPAPCVPSAEHCVLASVERSAVVDALRQLPDRQRQVVVLKYYGDLSGAEIAAAMGISTGAVKRHASRSRVALRSMLEHES